MGPAAVYKGDFLGLQSFGDVSIVPTHTLLVLRYRIKLRYRMVILPEDNHRKGSSLRVPARQANAIPSRCGQLRRHQAFEREVPRNRRNGRGQGNRM
jgi:hypothetical protein